MGYESSGINDFDCDGYRPIHHAILADDQARALKLLQEGALLNAPTESGDGALNLACRALSDERAANWVPLLLGWGAEIIDRDSKGWSALHHAVDRGLAKTVKALMAAGADPFLQAQDGKKPTDLSLDAEMKASLRVGALKG